MNLNTITEVKRPASADQITQWRDEYAWLAGGTWLFSEPQVATNIEGSIAMGFGWALTEKMVYDGGTMVNPALRNYRIPAFADVPRSEVFFADTYDSIGPLGAKSQGECAINPVAPAIAKLANATGVRFPHLPFTPDRIFSKLAEQP
jgi:putative selenate reductase molybdopterin-binding subunit